MITTLAIAWPIALIIHTLRTGARDLPRVWRHATRLERAALLLIVVPIPGPADELLVAFVVARVLRRIATQP